MKTHFGSLSAQFRGAALAGTFALLAATAASAQPVTFAQYVQQNGSTQEWTVTDSGSTTTVTASGAVYFSFSGLSGLPFSGPESAEFTLSAVTNSPGNCGVACGPGDSFTQPGYTGQFEFMDTGSDYGAVLLAGTFAVTAAPGTTGAQFSSSVGSSGGSFNASSTAGNLGQLVLTSQFLNFVGQTQENASWSLSSLIPNFATGAVSAGTAYPSGASPFTASATGTFSSNPGPSVASPEPGTWSLLLGSGLIGIALIRRRRTLKRVPCAIGV